MCLFVCFVWFACLLMGSRGDSKEGTAEGEFFVFPVFWLLCLFCFSRWDSSRRGSRRGQKKRDRRGGTLEGGARCFFSFRLFCFIFGTAEGELGQHKGTAAV